LIYLTSVFTHMQGAEVRHYLDEISRVLRPGGKCLTTCFLLNEEAEALIREGKSTQNLVYPLDDCFTIHREVPEATIGFKEGQFLSWLVERGFTLSHKCYGSWCGRPRLPEFYYQDILVYMKPAA
jgi:predicted SAM-dependent methyltransferase